jgi:hypothetical protein
MSGSGKRRAGRRLADALYSSIRSNPSEVVGRVGARKKYAETVHQGSSAHTIRGRGKMLKFRWDRGDFLFAAQSGRRRGNRRAGHFFLFHSVRHPGNKRPVRYLTTPLTLIARRNGFIVFGVGRGRTRLP